MQPCATRELTVRKAASMIYATSRPTAQQMYEVVKRLKCGVLRGECRKGRWQTTGDCVAEYMASQACQQQFAPVLGNEVLGSEQAPLNKVYHDVLKKYFLAVLFRRQASGYTKAFRRAVTAGQAVILILFVAIFATIARPWFAPASPAAAAVKQWLDNNVDGAKVTRWHPPKPAEDEASVVIRIEYRYLASRGRNVRTESLFTVKDGQVIGVESAW